MKTLGTIVITAGLVLLVSCGDPKSDEQLVDILTGAWQVDGTPEGEKVIWDLTETGFKQTVTRDGVRVCVVSGTWVLSRQSDAGFSQVYLAKNLFIEKVDCIPEISTPPLGPVPGTSTITIRQPNPSDTPEMSIESDGGGPQVPLAFGLFRP